MNENSDARPELDPIRNTRRAAEILAEVLLEVYMKERRRAKMAPTIEQARVSPAAPSTR